MMTANGFQQNSGDNQFVRFQIPKSLIQPRNLDFIQAKLIFEAYDIENQESDKTSADVVSAPLHYLLSTPGKNIRTRLMAAFNQWLKVPEEKLEIVSNSVELLHTASLLIDDIQDSSKLRRGLPVAHSIFGIAQTINSANHTYFLAQQKLEKLNNPQAFMVFTEELLKLHQGQGRDLYWRDSLICPTEEEYLEMVSNKTGGLFRLAVKLMQLESKQERDYIPLVDLLAVAFQIRDDYQNLWSDVYTGNKGLCEDITEGKFSFPIIHSIRSNPRNLVLPSILKQKSSDNEVKLCAKNIMEDTQSDKYTHQEICALIKRARALVERLTAEVGKAPEMEAILDYLESE